MSENPLLRVLGESPGRWVDEGLELTDMPESRRARSVTDLFVGLSDGPSYVAVISEKGFSAGVVLRYG
jgi:hypothetical protein